MGLIITEMRTLKFKRSPTCPKPHSQCRIGLTLKPGFQMLNFRSSHYPDALELSQNADCLPPLFQESHSPQPTHTFRSQISESSSCKNWTYFLTLHWVCFLSHVFSPKPNLRPLAQLSSLWPAPSGRILPSALFGTESHPDMTFNQEWGKKTCFF